MVQIGTDPAASGLTCTVAVPRFRTKQPGESDHGVFDFVRHQISCRAAGAALRGRVRRAHAILFAAALLAAATNAKAAAVVPAPGVQPHQLTVGSLLDLSGPLAAEGIAIKNGLTMGFDEINAKGGAGGRKIRLVTKDSAYDPAKAHAGAAALLKSGIFAMIGVNGTPPLSATLKQMAGANVLELFPFVPAHTSYAKLTQLEFALELPVAAQAQLGVKAVLDQRGTLRVGVLYQEGAFGRAVFMGAEDELARRGLAIARTETYAAGAGDLAPQIAQLRAAGVDLVVLGAVPQDALTAMVDARRQGWHPVFLCPSVCYTPETATLGGPSAEGLYSITVTPIPYPESRDAKLRDWARRYEQRFHALASAQALRAYLDTRLFAAALTRAGPHPTPLYFSRVLEDMPAWTDPDYGGVAIDYNAADHIGAHAGLLAKIAGGRWQIASAPLDLPAAP